MKNVLYVLQCAKTPQEEVTSNTEKIKLIALAIIELHWSEGIS